MRDTMPTAALKSMHDAKSVSEQFIVLIEDNLSIETGESSIKRTRISQAVVNVS